MNIHITLDYELFFGKTVGTVNACLINPTNKIIEVLNIIKAKATFYVDVGYLSRCEQLNCDLANYKKVVEQLKLLSSCGHDLQLHIHPHWEDAQYVNGQWDLENVRYRLHLFEKNEVETIVFKYTNLLKKITGKFPISYRAGGWCLQPFDYIADALYDSGVSIDSTVFREGVNDSELQGYNFSNAPELNSWRFDVNPLKETQAGRFIELPIADINVSPFFYWQFALAKKMGGMQHSSYGDGNPIKMSKKQLIRLLTHSSHSVVSIDGYKSKLLEIAYLKYHKRFGSNADFVLIGHPKATSDYSIKKLNDFLTNHSGNDQFITVTDWAKMK